MDSVYKRPKLWKMDKGFGAGSLDLGGVGWDGMDWIDLAQDRVSWRAFVKMVMNFRAP
jgi:hypothetical protein